MLIAKYTPTLVHFTTQADFFEHIYGPINMYPNHISKSDYDHLKSRNLANMATYLADAVQVSLAAPSPPAVWRGALLQTQCLLYSLILPTILVIAVP